MKFERALPELRPFLELWSAGGGFNLTVPPSIAARPFIASFPAPPTPDPLEVTVQEIFIRGIRCLLVRPAGGAIVPGILAFHGGGGVIGSPELELPLYAHYARSGFAVISPAYRLAPEHPYPAAFDDAETCWESLQDLGPGLKIDMSKVGLFGSSAGSWIAAGLAIRLSNKSSAAQPSMVVLDSVLVDDRVKYQAQVAGHENEVYWIWSAQNARDAQRYIFGDNVDALPVEASPLRSKSKEDFRALGPHYLSVCALDSLVDHGLLYAARLLEAGVLVETHVWAGTVHGFVTLTPDSKVTARARAAYVEAFRRGL